MTPKEIYKLLGDYPQFTKKIVKLNHEIHDLMRAMTENCQQMAIHGASLSGLPKGNKIPDPVYNAFLETEKLTSEYQEKIKQLSVKILQIIDNKSKIDYALNMLKPIERNIVELRCIRHLNWMKIAEMTVYSDRQCRSIKNKAINSIMQTI